MTLYKFPWPNLTIAIFYTLVLLTIPCLADRGGFWTSQQAQPGEPLQRAVIARSGNEVMLILETVLEAGSSGVLVEFFPLPAKPEISLADESLFEKLDLSLAEQKVRPVPNIRTSFDPGIKVLEEKRLEAHDLATVEVFDVVAFESFIKSRFEKVGLEPRPFTATERSVVQSYLAQGFHYFVVDTVTLSEGQQSVKPVCYRMTGDYIFYPYQTSRILGGRGVVSLYFALPLNKMGIDFLDLFQTWWREEGDFGPPSSRPSVFSRGTFSNSALTEISQDLGEFFPGGAVIMPVKYKGSLEFTQDLKIHVEPIASRSTPDPFELSPAEISKGLIDHPEWPYFRGPQGQTLLHQAAGRNDTEILSLLLDFIEIETGDRDGKTALCYAVEADKLQAAKLLLEHKARTLGDYEKTSPLHLASSYEMAILLLSAAEPEESNLEPLIHYAAKAGNERIVQACLDSGTPVNQKNIAGETALHKAAIEGRLEIVDLLLKQGAEPLAKDNPGATPVFRAIKSDRAQVLSRLLSEDAVKTGNGYYLWVACYFHSLECARLLLKTEESGTYSHGSGMSTALHKAAGWGNPEIVKALLERGADPEALDKRGKSPRDLASGKSKEILQVK